MKVNMAHCDQSPGLISRKIWQVLFKLYQSRGGNMDRLDSMLCDLYTTEEIVRAAQRQRKPVTFWWEGGTDWYTNIEETAPMTADEILGDIEVIYDPSEQSFEVMGYPQEPEKFGWE